MLKQRYNPMKNRYIVECKACNFGKEFGGNLCSCERTLYTIFDDKPCNTHRIYSACSPDSEHFNKHVIFSNLIFSNFIYMLVVQKT